MKLTIALFYHSLVSDWNHGNAHFLRGICSELIARGHDVRVFEPENGWSLSNLIDQEGPDSLRGFSRAYPLLKSTYYSPSLLKLDEALDGADLAIVHEWNDTRVVEAVASYRRRNSTIRIFFHDTHHRAVSDPRSLHFDLMGQFDAVLAYGESLREIYRRHGWTKNVHVWHEAADTRVFRPKTPDKPLSDIVWIGNWGDEERTSELEEFLIRPAADLNLSGTAYGVRYPPAAVWRMRDAGFAYKGWIPNYQVPDIFALHRVTVHIPRRPYVEMLSGIPTIRPFEAMACGIPVITATWRDTEGLFHEGVDFLNANSGPEMRRLLNEVLTDRRLADSLRENGLQTIARRHTCSHRVDELLRIYCEGISEPAEHIEPEQLRAVAG
jgi:spore maturation protein CgeB